MSYEWSPRAAQALGLSGARGGQWARQYPRWPSTATVCKHFGSWAAAVRAAGLPPARRVTPRRGLRERVDAVRRLDAQGYATAEIAALLEISPRTVRNYRHASACRDCGTVTVASDRCPRCAARRARPPDWSREEVLRAVGLWMEEEGRAPTSGDWTPTAEPTSRWAREYPRWPSYVTVKTLFGSWRKGLEAAGCPPLRRRWNREQILSSLREFAAATGRAPSQADLERRRDLPAPGTVRAHLGSLRAAREAAGLPAPAPSRRRGSARARAGRSARVGGG